MRRLVVALGCGLVVAWAPLVLGEGAAAVVRPLQSIWPFPNSSFATACTDSGAGSSLALHHLLATLLGFAALFDIFSKLQRSTSTVDRALDPSAAMLRRAVPLVAVLAVCFYSAPLLVDFMPRMSSCAWGEARLFRAAFTLLGAGVLYLAAHFVIFATSKSRS